MRKFYLFLAFSMIVGIAFGQQRIIRCYSDEYLNEEIRKNPERGKSLDALNRRVDEIIAARAIGANAKPVPPRINTVYIPVVFNVVYRTAAENISLAQIQSQIDVLNEDYSATNVEILNPGAYNFAGYFGVVANCKIQFCLNTVVRTPTTVTSFTSTNDPVKKTSSGGQDPLNPATMLNLWSCNLGGGLLGYATFPGGSLSLDGVVCLYSAIGTRAAGATATPYDEGRTATHEIGHWLGLYHTFQGACSRTNDKVDDTPPLDGPNFSCPPIGERSTCRGTPLEQYMNYMDYVDDLCMYMFSKGQLARIDGFIAASRAPYCLASCPAQLVTSNIIQNSKTSTLLGEKLQVYPTVAQNFTNIVITSQIKGPGEITLLSQTGSILKRQLIVLPNGTSTHMLLVSDLPNGFYFIKVTGTNGTIETRKLIVQH
jgi:Pregnancy-associated plasma protein-A